MLRENVADIDWIKTSAPGSDDDGVWRRAIAERRVLLTFDKDFGELSRTTKMPLDCGVILLRVPMPLPAEIEALAKIILARSDWAGQFSVIEPGRIRSRSLAARV
jgi:predicted nuclease of predicted toxin-antitoxin system